MGKLEELISLQQRSGEIAAKLEEKRNRIAVLKSHIDEVTRRVDFSTRYLLMLPMLTSLAMPKNAFHMYVRCLFCIISLPFSFICKKFKARSVFNKGIVIKMRLAIILAFQHLEFRACMIKWFCPCTAVFFYFYYATWQ